MTLNKTERILAAINYFLPHDDLYQYCHGPRKIRIS